MCRLFTSVIVICGALCCLFKLSAVFCGVILFLLCTVRMSSAYIT
jgi:hypothetical protein